MNVKIYLVVVQSMISFYSSIHKQTDSTPFV